MMPVTTTATTNPALTPGITNGRYSAASAITSDSSFSTAPDALACRCSLAMMPSMAFSALRRNSVAGSNSSGQGDPGIMAAP